MATETFCNCCLMALAFDLSVKESKGFRGQFRTYLDPIYTKKSRNSISRFTSRVKYSL